MNKNEIVPVVFAADLGGTHLRAALIDGDGRIHAQHKQDTPHGPSARCIVDALVKAANQLSETTLGVHVVGASIMVPGTIDKENTTVVRSPNLPCLDDYGLKAELEKDLAWPVLLENDANAAAMGETWIGAARGHKDAICITLGTGVGGGVVLDGKLWRGADGSAGEIGHTTVEPFTGPKCKCGNTGCLEMFTSATAIVRMTNEGFEQFPDSVLRHQQVTAQKVFEAGCSGDALALAVFKKAGQYLGVGIANLITLLGPEVVVIGGGAANAWDLFETDMREQIRTRAFPRKEVLIKTAECGDNAGLLGAARLAFDHHLFDAVEV